MRLASGIAPILDYLKSGVRVGLGVDGSASNDSSHLLGEARQAMLLSRLGAGVSGASLSGEEAAPLMTARQALELATIGGAKVLGRDDIGSLAVGKCADLIAIDLNRLEFAGAQVDPVAAVLFCQPVKTTHTIVGGEFVVRNGEVVGFDLEKHIHIHNQAAMRLINGEVKR
jgi:cytosine/adenosine deaminase-related metal-dependent hydrolase